MSGVGSASEVERCSPQSRVRGGWGGGAALTLFVEDGLVGSQEVEYELLGDAAGSSLGHATGLEARGHAHGRAHGSNERSAHFSDG